MAFVPATQGVKQPDPPIDVTLLIKPAAGGPVIRQEIADPSGGFNLMLDPGDLSVAVAGGLGRQHEQRHLSVADGSPTFRVPATGCAYVGRTFFSYLRLPPGSAQKQTQVIFDVANKFNFDPQHAYILFLHSGSLIPKKATVDLPDATERVSGSEDCDVDLAEF